MNDYTLLDFGDGRRLERFGPWTIDRPCPAAEQVAPSRPDLWPAADARFERTSTESGEWTRRADVPERWTIRPGSFSVELKLSPFGHVGLFPEQAANWDWIARQVAEAGRPLKVLNLFAYTGASTLAASAAGAAEVVHVDAARNTVAEARRNAEISLPADAPIRWIAEDARKFVARELRRGNRYDAVILDPPSYGHGPHGEVWRLSQHLAHLLAACDELTADRRAFLLLTAHTPGYTADRLAEMLADAMGISNRAATVRERLPIESLAAESHGEIWSSSMSLRAPDARNLPSGHVARWSYSSRSA